jgi:phospholipid transport system substrate-binding protein
MGIEARQRSEGQCAPIATKRRLLFAIAVALAFSSASAAAAADGATKRSSEEAAAFLAAPTELVSVTVADVIAILQDAELSSSERRARIERVAFDVFHFETMSKLVLARNWKKFDDAQRREFVEQFKLHLSRNYGSRLDRYQQTDVRIVGARIEPRDDVTVMSKVVGGGSDGIELDYRLRSRKGEWKVIDVVIEGVSMLANFRSQFRDVMSKKGPDALLEQMRVKNAEPPSDEPAASGVGTAS